jgi:hypothetical protein
LLVSEGGLSGTESGNQWPIFAVEMSLLTEIYAGFDNWKIARSYINLGRAS